MLLLSEICVSQDVSVRARCLSAGVNSWGQSWVRNLIFDFLANCHSWPKMHCYKSILKSWLLENFKHDYAHQSNLSIMYFRKCILMDQWDIEYIHQKYVKTHFTHLLMSVSVHLKTNNKFCCFFLFFTQKFIWVKVLLGNKTMPAVWSDLWDW